MADLLDTAISEATKGEKAGELVRQSRRFEKLREDPSWQELREVVKAKRTKVTEVLGRKALAGAHAQHLRDEGIYSRGFLDGCQMLLDLPEDVEKRLESMIQEAYIRLRREAADAAVSPYT
jgi:hypothetical protein